MEEADIIDVAERQHDRRATNDTTTSDHHRSVRPPRQSTSVTGGIGLGGPRPAKRGSGGGGKTGGWVGSTKLGRLEIELREMKKRRAGAKAVVFSQVPAYCLWVIVLVGEGGRRRACVRVFVAFALVYSYVRSCVRLRLLLTCLRGTVSVRPGL